MFTERLRAHWAHQAHQVLQCPAEPARIRMFEDRCGVVLSTSFWAYLSVTDGFPSDITDDLGYRFWSLAEIVPVSTFEGGQFAFEGAESYYLFADYLQWSWGYAIRLDASGADRDVVLIGTANGRPQPVAATFAEFVEFYLRDAPALYPPD